MTNKIYPLTFTPIFKEKVWGGTRLQQLLNKNIPANTLIGESWELVDRGDDVSLIRNGCFVGKSIRDVARILGESLLGSKKSCDKFGRFPLLIKFLDASTKLSVQVHPTDAQAQQFGEDDPGKTEMWYVLYAAPDAKIIYGCDPSIPEALNNNAVDASIENLLHTQDIQPGDFIYMPAGQVHTMLGSCVVLEIQQNSDVTYRIYDWGRMGLDGKPRTLHLKKSLACIDYKKPKNHFQRLAHITDTQKRLVECQYFTADYISKSDSFTDTCTGETFKIFAPVYGSGTIQFNGIESLPFACGDIILLPAALGKYTIIAQNEIRFLLIS